MNRTVSVTAKPGRKHTMSAVFAFWFVFLFVVSYGLLTMRVVLQDRTLGAQADLIHLLFKESRRFTTTAEHQPFATTRHQSKNNEPAQPRVAQVPTIQDPSTPVQQDQKASQISSSQEKPQASTKPGKHQHKAGRRSPFRPPDKATDPSDMRRTLFSI